jgi:hypothetical protein
LKDFYCQRFGVVVSARSNLYGHRFGVVVLTRNNDGTSVFSGGTVPGNTIGAVALIAKHDLLNELNFVRTEINFSEPERENLQFIFSSSSLIFLVLLFLDRTIAVQEMQYVFNDLFVELFLHGVLFAPLFICSGSREFKISTIERLNYEISYQTFGRLR